MHATSRVAAARRAPVRVRQRLARQLHVAEAHRALRRGAAARVSACVRAPHAAPRKGQAQRTVPLFPKLARAVKVPAGVKGAAAPSACSSGKDTSAKDGAARTHAGGA